MVLKFFFGFMGFYEFMCHECWKWGNESSMASSLPSGCGRTRGALQDPALRTRKAGGEMRSFMVPPPKKSPTFWAKQGAQHDSTWVNQNIHMSIGWLIYIYIYIVTSFEGIFIPLKHSKSHGFMRTPWWFFAAKREFFAGLGDGTVITSAPPLVPMGRMDGSLASMVEGQMGRECRLILWSRRCGEDWNMYGECMVNGCATFIDIIVNVLLNVYTEYVWIYHSYVHVLFMYDFVMFWRFQPELIPILVMSARLFDHGDGAKKTRLWWSNQPLVLSSIMLVNYAMRHPPVVTIFIYRWYVYPSQSWVVFIFLKTTLYNVSRMSMWSIWSGRQWWFSSHEWFCFL